MSTTPTLTPYDVPPLKLVKPRWGNNAPLPAFVIQAAADGFDAVELGLPNEACEQAKLVDLASEHGLELIGEVASGDWWVPQPHRSPEDHLRDVVAALDACVGCNAWHLNAMAGYDAWPINQSVAFLGACQQAAHERGVLICFETHRSRSLSTPWSTLAILEQLPNLTLTCDFSHWVVVCERLLDGCEQAVTAAANRCHHIHARIGHAQGPQVADPAAPEFATERAAHLDWWQQCWASMATRGASHITMNPEFGVDRYLPLLPYTEQPVADIQQIQRWMAVMLRQAYADWCQTRQSASTGAQA